MDKKYPIPKGAKYKPSTKPNPTLLIITPEANTTNNPINPFSKSNFFVCFLLSTLL